MLQQKIKDDIKIAMKARETVKLEVLRGISAAFTNELISKKCKPSDELSDDEAILVVQRLAKQRKDSIEQYRAGNRDDLAEAEKEELKYIKTYLPQMMARDEIKKLAIAKRDKMALTDPSKKGILMGALMKDLKGKAEGGDVKDVLNEIFENS